MKQAAPVIDWYSDNALQRLLAHPQQCEDLFGGSALVERLLDCLSPGSHDAQWYRPAGIWLDGRWVAAAGFKGPPDSGRVEIGYRVHPAYQRRGLASKLVRWLCQRAANHNLRLVLAVTEAGNHASQRLLARNGFEHQGDLLRANQQRLQRWRYRLPKPAPHRSSRHAVAATPPSQSAGPVHD